MRDNSHIALFRQTEGDLSGFIGIMVMIRRRDGQWISKDPCCLHEAETVPLLVHY